MNVRIRSLLPFLQWWPEVNRATLSADALAGLTGAIVVLPQGVAFAVIAGMPPEYGLYAAMVPAAIAALFGSSRMMVSGPATPISILLFSSLSTLAVPGSEAYVTLALTLTFMVGLVQLAMGLARLGNLVNFISHSVVVGFSAGAAMLIVSSQISNFFGLDLPRGLQPYEILYALWEQSRAIHWSSVLVGVFTVGVGVLARRHMPRVPYMIVAMTGGMLLAWALNHYANADVALVTASVSALPALTLPSFSPALWQDLAPAALAMTVLALSQSVSIARSQAARTGDLVDGNQEFIGQGLSNILGPFFSSYASAGSFNRSAVNYDAGARTPLAPVFSAVSLVLVLLLVAPLLAYMPKAATAGVLLLVALGIIDTAQIRTIVRCSRPDTVVLGVTFLATVMLSLDFAILLGMLVSLVIFLHRSSQPRLVSGVPDPRQAKRRLSDDPALPECPQMKILQINGALFFGAAYYVAERLQEIFVRNPEQKHLLILARSVNFIDASSADVLGGENRRRRSIGGGVYFHQLNEGARGVLRRGGYLAEIGADHLFETKGDAISAIFERLNRNVCLRCNKRIFNECKSLPREGGGDR